jgi:hypothetical protein
MQIGPTELVIGSDSLERRGMLYSESKERLVRELEVEMMLPQQGEICLSDGLAWVASPLRGGHRYFRYNSQKEAKSDA